MGTLFIETPELIEPFACTPIYCSGLARAFVANGDLHMLWFIQQPGIEGVERLVNLRTIIKVEALASARTIVDEALKAARERRVLDS